MCVPCKLHVLSVFCLCVCCVCTCVVCMYVHAVCADVSAKYTKSPLF